MISSFKFRTILFLLSVILTCTLVSAQSPYHTDLIITSKDGIWTDSRAYSTINAAVTAIGSSVRTLTIASPQSVTTITIPSNITLRFERDGAINNSGQLTIQTKNIEAPNRQIFTGSGDIDFASGTILKSGWFSTVEVALSKTSDDTITLLITKPQTITTTSAVGANVSLQWESPSNILTVSTGITVSGIKSVEAGDFQLFAGSGTWTFVDGINLKLSWFDSLRSAVTWIGSTLATIKVYPNAVIDYDLTIPYTTTIDLISNSGSYNISGGVTLTDYSKTSSAINLLMFNNFADPSGSVSAASALTTACATGKVIVISSGTYKIDSSISCAAPIVYMGGMFTSSNSSTLTLTGPQSGGDGQRFAGNLVVIYGIGATYEISPEYWYSGSGDYGIAVSKAIASIANVGGKIVFKERRTATTPINGTGIRSGIVFEGRNGQFSGTNLGQLLTFSHTGVGFDISNSESFIFRDIAFKGDPTTTPSVGILMARNVAGSGCGRHTFENVTFDYFSKFTIAPIYSYGAEELMFINGNYLNLTANGRTAVFTASNVDNVTSSFITLGTGVQSNSTVSIIGGAWYAIGGATNTVFDLDGVVDWHMQGGLVNNDGGRSLWRIRTANAASSNVSMKGVRDERTTTGATYGLYFDTGGSVNISLFDIADNHFQVNTRSIYAEDNVTLSYFKYNTNSDSTGIRAKNITYSNIDLITAPLVSVSGGDISNSTIRGIYSNFTIGGSTTNTEIFDYGTGDLIRNGNLKPYINKGVDFTASASGNTHSTNILAFYEQGTWTPVLTCATPGDLSVSYGTQSGTYTRIGNQVTVTVSITTTSFTWSTASGGVKITGLPFTPGVSHFFPVSAYQGYTSATHPVLSGQIVGAVTSIFLSKSGSAQTLTGVQIADIPSAGAPQFYFTFSFFI